MQPIFFLTLIVGVMIVSAFGFRPISFYGRSSSQLKPLRLAPQMMNIDYSLLTAIAEIKPDDYQYGAVNAPGWVLPVGALLAIMTAAIPILLRPGEKALDQQRIDEATTNKPFGKRRDV